jgi:cytochrome bd-type quinol oxidase subunit 2
MVVIGMFLILSSSIMLWGADTQAAQAAFSWKTVGLMTAVGVPLAGLAFLLWRDGHPVWAIFSCLPLLFALIGLYNGLFRQTVAQ